MKFTFTLLAILYSTYAISQENATYTNSQDIPKTEVTALKHIGQNYELTITSVKKFYVGGNIHILNIGTKKITRSRIEPGNAKSITFIIPENEFDFLISGNEMWMSYGDRSKSKPMSDADIKAWCETSPSKLWYLGKFDKSILK